MDDPNHTEGGLSWFLRRLVRSIAATLGYMLAVVLVSSGALALVGGLVALAYGGWSAVPLGLALGAVAGVVVAIGFFAGFSDTE